MRGLSSPGSRANRHGGLCIIRKQKHDDAGSREGQGLSPSATPPPPANPFLLEQTDTSAAAATRRTGMTGFRCWHERRQREKREKRRQRRNLCAAEALACRVHVCKCGALHGAGVVPHQMARCVRLLRLFTVPWRKTQEDEVYVGYLAAGQASTAADALPPHALYVLCPLMHLVGDTISDAQCGATAQASPDSCPMTVSFVRHLGLDWTGGFVVWRDADWTDEAAARGSDKSAQPAPRACSNILERCGWNEWTTSAAGRPRANECAPRGGWRGAKTTSHQTRLRVVRRVRRAAPAVASSWAPVTYDQRTRSSGMDGQTDRVSGANFAARQSPVPDKTPSPGERPVRMPACRLRGAPTRTKVASRCGEDSPLHRAFLREALESPWVVWSAFIDCPKPIACTVGIASRRTRDLRSSQLLAGALPCPPPPQCPCQRALARRPTMTTRLELTRLQDPGGMKQGSDLAVGRRPLATLSVRAEKGFITSFLTSKATAAAEN
ncbi:hypothetical protein PCL_09353 [Purpureocillium lilacinum]|uniref:Uncharacterized protein n=1 Tax=Purpureocillium lilacinum TaxID=33203 RepID=A0A2U3EHT9_PURLI|nr:hypothetical protein PCL_09353 [Purpureocillium lilacinum]